MKRCARCEETKSLSDFHRDRRNDADGRQSYCKVCRALDAETKRRANGVKPLKRNVSDALGKRCTICCVVKPLDEFGCDTRTCDGRTSECLLCKRVSSNSLNRAKGMPERIRQNPNATIKKCKTCRKTLHVSSFYITSHGRNADGLLPHCKTCWGVKSAEMRRKLAAYYTQYSSGRRARSLNATPKWLSAEQLEAIVAIYRHAMDCTLVTGERYEVDHIIPITNKVVCGLHVPWNLQVLPRAINRRKSNKLLA
jgi:5-methylcytosine-specific restriction endonuclease McrA